MKKTALYLVNLIFIFLMSSSVYAQDVAVSSYVDTNEAVLGTPIRFTIKIDGKQDVSAFDLPKIDGFDISYIGPSRKMAFVNGQYSSSVEFNYSLLPLKAGKLIIPPLIVPIENENFTTESLVINVSESSVAAGSTVSGQFQSLEDKMMLNIEPIKRKVYLNEPIPLKIRLFIAADISMQVRILPEFNKEGFIIDDYSKPREYQQTIADYLFNVIEFNTTAYPTRTGEISIGPAVIEADLLVNRKRVHDDFFSSFFGRQERRPVKLTSNVETTEVQSVPDKNKPESFTGAVGVYDFQVSVSPKEVHVGDPLTLKMSITGTGSFDSVRFPELAGFEDFKLYEPDIKEDKNNKYLERVIIPADEDIAEVPVIEFSYFDVEANRYETIKRGPFPINVLEPLDDDFKIIGGTQQPIISFAPEKYGQDIVFIKERLGSLKKKGSYLKIHPGMIALFIILNGVLLFLYFQVHESQRIKTDKKYAQKLYAPKKARKGLHEAKQLIEKGQSNQAYDILFKTLIQYFVQKLHIASGAVNRETIRDALPPKKQDNAVLEKFQMVLDRFDEVRYASKNLHKAEMIQTYELVVKIIDYFERNV